MTTTDQPVTHVCSIACPAGLPSFAAFASYCPLEPLPALVPGEEELVTDAMVPVRRESLVKGRAAAHMALDALGIADGPILAGPNREPLWPEGATGSISHAAGFAVALVAPTSQTDGVGIDIEEHRHTPELWDHVPTRDERSWLQELEAQARDRMLTALFSAKESIYKAFYPRRQAFFGFERASLTTGELGFVARLTDGIDRDYPIDRDFEIACRWFGDLVVTALVLPKTNTAFVPVEG